MGMGMPKGTFTPRDTLKYPLHEPEELEDAGFPTASAQSGAAETGYGS